MRLGTTRVSATLAKAPFHIMIKDKDPLTGILRRSEVPNLFSLTLYNVSVTKSLFTEEYL